MFYVFVPHPLYFFLVYPSVFGLPPLLEERGIEGVRSILVFK
jgi:hypothetical protein